MQVSETELRQAICQWGRSIFERGLTSGSSGNISARLSDGYLLTPTNSCLGFLDAARLSKLDRAGNHVSGDKPTKEIPLHLTYYEARPGAGAIVHLHSTYATALSCRSDLDPQNVLTPVTPYVVMRVGRVPLLPYSTPGSDQVREPLLKAAPSHAAVLLANHGPVVTGASLEAAVFAAEELEEAARLAFLLEGRPHNVLTEANLAELAARF